MQKGLAKNNLYKIQKILWVLVADVINCIRRNRKTIFAIFALRRNLHYMNNTFDNIIPISKVALTITVVEDLNCFAFQQFVSKAKVLSYFSANALIAVNKLVKFFSVSIFSSR